MTEREISQILLIRSVEESDTNYFTPEVQLDSLIVSGAEENDISLIQTRAQYLFQKLPDALKEIPQALHLPLKWGVIVCTGIFSLGIVFNYLGPGEKIHVLYNPVVLLILWNICVFVAFLARNFFLKEKAGRNNARPHFKTGRPGTSQASHAAPVRPGYTSSAFLWIFRKIWFFLHQQISKRKRELTRIPLLANMTYRYLELCWDMNQQVFFSRFTRFIHVLAVCLITGALSGVYMRGLFFEYNVIWKSTFIHNADDIALILNVFFGLPSQLLHGIFIDASRISNLLSPNGEPAAAWIHLFAVSAFMFVIPQRFFLMFLESRRLRALSRHMTINPDEPYYARCIGLAREMQANRLREDISVVVQDEASRLSESVALYARDRFYNDEVVPHLIEFRNSGGRITDLEHLILAQSENFKAELDGFLETAQQDFSRSVGEGVSGVIGKKLSVIKVNVGEGFRIKPEVYQQALDGTITDSITGGISLAVTAAVAATIGTLSGGFGKVLGVAVISTLLHTTGPVGFIVGALAGLLLGGSASIIAKDKITDAVKNRKFPGFSTRLLLGEAKMTRIIEEGRIQVYTLIKKQIKDTLITHTDEITNQILSNISSARNKR